MTTRYTFHGRSILAPVCPDCEADMMLKESHYGPFWSCSRYPDCTATHSAHPNGYPLGIPAGKDTREARRRAHAAFDRMWKTDDERDDAYTWLAEQLELRPQDCHIGKFDKPTCDMVIYLVEQEIGPA